ncbi:MAG: OmpA family protein [Gammaproteobacteria bacterium]|nr:OmpA family protein [Gammaproteobacteria bacterium]
MTSESINRMTIIGAGSLAIIVFGGLCIRHNVPAIEAELGRRAEAELREQRMSWAKIELSGRDLTLSGVAPDTAAQEAALSSATIWGVRKVSSKLSTVDEYVTENATPAKVAPGTRTVAPDPASGAQTNLPATNEPFRTRLTVVDQRLILNGAVPGERQRREFVELAQSQFGIAAVEVQLQQTDNAPEGWLQAAAVALEIVDQLVFGEVNIVEQSLHVTGITATREGDERIRLLVAEQLPQGYAGTAETGARSELESVLRTSPELAARVSQRGQASSRDELTRPRVQNSNRCESEFKTEMNDRRILFATASNELTADSLRLLDDLAIILKTCSGTRINIEGHTDDQGLMENNLALSQRRAESVMQHFVTRGISLGRLAAQGFGEERPLVPNETADNRAVNRRIEFVFESE